MLPIDKGNLVTWCVIIHFTILLLFVQFAFDVLNFGNLFLSWSLEFGVCNPNFVDPALKSLWCDPCLRFFQGSVVVVEG